VISGTPTTGGTSAVTITVTDSAGATGTATFNWTITNTVTVTSPGDQANGSGTAITALPISASDSSSTATLSYSDGGTLPAGLTIDPSSGVISGTPTTGGTSAVTITVTDSAGATGSATFNWVITNTVTVTSPGDQSDLSGAPITPLTVSASDSSSVATLTYSDGGTLPTGLTIDPSSGAITGTPTTGGTFAVTITATDNAGFTGTATFNWAIVNTVTVTSPGDQSSGSGTAITPLTITASDSSSTATLSYTDSGTLPPGLSIDPSSGVISGTPTTAGSYPVTITALDNAGFSGGVSFTWTVTNTVSVTSPGDQTDG
jgi:Putative Ig domain